VRRAISCAEWSTPGDSAKRAFRIGRRIYIPRILGLTPEISTQRGPVWVAVGSATGQLQAGQGGPPRGGPEALSVEAQTIT